MKTLTKIHKITIPKKWARHFGKGIECLYLRISKNIGVKIFPNRANAEFSYKNQKKAAKHDIGPRVYSSVKLCDASNLKGYIYDGDAAGVEFKRAYAYFYETEVASRVGICTDIGHLVDKMKDLKLSSGDLHKWNIGFVRGKLVCIDFGKESVS